MATRELRVSFTGDTKDLDRAFQKVDRGLKNTSKEADKSGGKIHGFATVTSKGFGRVGVAAGGMAVAGAGAAALLAKSFVSGASDINESLTKNQVLFGKFADGVDRFSKRSAGSLGISRAAALEAVGTFGNLFNALDVGPQKSAKLSTGLVKLAADMASFNNASPEETLEAIRSGLVGETEPLRRFGVNINDAQLRQQALQMGLVKTTKEVLPANAKALASVALITKQTSAAHGDFARTSGGLANQQRILKARLADAGAELGAKLMPAALAAVKAINSLFRSSSSGGKAIAGMARIAQNAAGWIKGAWSDAVRAVGRFTDRNREDIQSVGRAMRNVGIAVKAVVENVLIPVIKRMLPIFKGVFDGIIVVARGLVRFVSGVLTGNWKKAWQGIKDIVRGAVKAIIAVWGGIGKALLDAAVAGGKAIGKGILKGLGNLGHLLLAKVKDSLDFVADSLNNPGGIPGAIGKAIGKGVSRKLGLDGDGLGKIGGGDFPAGGSSGSLMGAQPALAPFAAAGARFGLHVSSGRRPGSITSSGNTSFHSSGEAIDMADGRGPDANKLRYFNYLKTTMGSRLAELIYTPGGMGIKNGRPFRYTGSVAADHYDHVHVALDTGRPGVGDGHGRRPGTGDGLGRFVSTSYGPPWGGIQGGGTTATGVNLHGNPHTYGIAVDPSRLKLGKSYYVWPNPFGYHGKFKAFDTGGAIKGNRIDFYDWRGRSKQLGWGRRSVEVSTTAGKSASAKSGGKGSRPSTIVGTIGAGMFGPSGSKGPAAQVTQGTFGAGAAALYANQPGELDYIQADAANATLTAGTADDINAATSLRDYYQRAYNKARRTADPRDDIEAASNLKGAIDALAALTDAVTEANRIADERAAVTAESVANQRLLLKLAGQGDQILAAVIAAVNGGIGGRVGLGSQTPSYAGGVARY